MDHQTLQHTITSVEELIDREAQRLGCSIKKNSEGQYAVCSRSFGTAVYRDLNGTAALLISIDNAKTDERRMADLARVADQIMAEDAASAA